MLVKDPVTSVPYETGVVSEKTHWPLVLANLLCLVLVLCVWSVLWLG